MRILTLSDLHLEFEEEMGWYNQYGNQIYFNPDLDGVDVLVLAGDVHLGTSGLKYIKEWATRVPHVIYVLGNHEYYGNDLETLVDVMKDKVKDVPNIHVLEQDEIVIDGVRFLGATLWTDLKKEDPLVVMVAQQCMSDYIHIKKGGGVVFAQDLMTINAQAKEWLKRKIIDEPFVGKTVVVTHHLPSSVVVDQKWKGDPLSYAYCNTDCDALIPHISLWLFGHQHHSARFEVGTSRLFSNPRGYVPDELNPDFDVYAYVEI